MNFLARRNLAQTGLGNSQTPQVWSGSPEFMNPKGELRFNWDFVAALFPAGQVERQLGTVLRIAKPNGRG